LVWSFFVFSDASTCFLCPDKWSSLLGFIGGSDLDNLWVTPFPGFARGYGSKPLWGLKGRQNFPVPFFFSFNPLSSFIGLAPHVGKPSLDPGLQSCLFSRISLFPAFFLPLGFSSTRGLGLLNPHLFFTGRKLLQAVILPLSYSLAPTRGTPVSNPFPHFV